MVSVNSAPSKRGDAIPRWFLNVLILGFVIYCAHLLAQLTWRLVNIDQPVFISSDVHAHSLGEQEAARDSAVLLTLNLFGKQNVAQPQQQLMETVEAPKTRLQLELKGVFTAKRESESSAIVAERGKSGEYFKIGEKLPGNAELVAVYNDRVLLKRNGRLETLGFEDAATNGNSIAKVNPSVSRGPITSPKQFVDVAEKKLTENPVTALASVGLKPVKEGEASGYIYDGNNPMLAGMNLKPGDVVRSVNGYPLGDINKDRELLKQLYQEGSLEVEVEREGTSFYINYPLR